MEFCLSITGVAFRLFGPLTVRYSEAWLHLKRSTRVPLFAGEKVELVEGFRPYLDNGVLDMIHPDVAYSGGITGCQKIADYAALTRTPVGLHSGPCSLIRFYASMHIGAATQNFFKVENALGAFRGNKEKMAQGPEPVVRNSLFLVSEGPLPRSGAKRRLAAHAYRER
jgi:L-alanine-DL-glutamate epimerase-like enolase superfamily enzyme